ncbi:hypothetical protein HK096_007789, partial [Nowakowskiella sp. JEL0078]
MDITNYEKQRELNILRNRQILAELGLSSLSTHSSSALLPTVPSNSNFAGSKKKNSKPKTKSTKTNKLPNKVKRSDADSSDIRRSSRISIQPKRRKINYSTSSADENSTESEYNASNSETDDEFVSEPEEYDYDRKSTKKGGKLPPFVPPKDRSQVTEDIVGSIPQIPVGMWWISRQG